MSATPVIPDSPFEAFRLAVDIAGGQVKFAKILGVTQGAICKRLKRGQSLSAEESLVVAAATGIPKEQLCPRVFASNDPAPPIHGAGTPEGSLPPDSSGVDPIESARA